MRERERHRLKFSLCQTRLVLALTKVENMFKDNTKLNPPVHISHWVSDESDDCNF